MGIIAVSFGILVTCGTGLCVGAVHKFLHTYEFEIGAGKKERRPHSRRDSNEERLEGLSHRARMNK